MVKQIQSWIAMIYNCGDVGNSYVCLHNSSQQSEKRTD